MRQWTRRGVLGAAGAGLFSGTGRAETLSATVGCPIEWSFETAKAYGDKAGEIDVDVVVTDPAGREQRVPAFWSGDGVWRVRYAPHTAGRYRYRTVSTDEGDRDLHGRTGELAAEPYTGANPLYRRGAIRVARDRRHFEHAGGTPFFWLGDTWWMALARRLAWPDEFQLLVEDRVAKGFTVIQLVAGLMPDMGPFDPRGANEAGYPWTPDFRAIDPAYFDMADLRIRHLVRRGLVPCVLGCWGYYLPMMGIEKMKRHWRYVVARWGAYPVVWCLAGEGTMPWYLSKTRDEDSARQKREWTEVARYVRAIDPFHRLVTIHPSRSARASVEDPAVLDFDMLQTGHGDRTSIPNTVASVVASQEQTPKMPVLVGEVCYEGILSASREEVQRIMFWTSMLNGAAGHTYGANGIWQVNRPEEPFGPSPHGQNWGDTPWETAYRYPGSRQMGLGRRLLERYPWWRFESRPDWAEPRWTKENYLQPYAAGIPGEIRVIYIPPGRLLARMTGLEPGVHYRGFFWDPSSGREKDAGAIAGDAAGEWKCPLPPTRDDWVLVAVKQG